MSNGAQVYDFQWSSGNCAVILVGILTNAAKFRRSSSVVKTSPPPAHESAIIHTGYGSRVDEIRRASALGVKQQC